MAELLPAVITAGIGLVLLVLVVVLALRPVRRFSRANVALRSDVATGVASLHALVNVRRRDRE